MAQDEPKFVNVVKTFQLNDRKIVNSSNSNVCEKCRKVVSDETSKGDDPFSRRDLQNYIYQSSARNFIHIQMISFKLRQKRHTVSFQTHFDSCSYDK